LHQQRIVEILQSSEQILSDLLLSDHIPVPDQPGNHRVDLKLLRDSMKIRFLRGNNPTFHPYILSLKIQKQEITRLLTGGLLFSFSKRITVFFFSSFSSSAQRLRCHP